MTKLKTIKELEAEMKHECTAIEYAMYSERYKALKEVLKLIDEMEINGWVKYEELKARING